MRHFIPTLLCLSACGGPLPATHFAGLFEADVETTVTPAGGSTSTTTGKGEMTLTATSGTQLRLEDPQCPVTFVFDSEDDAGFYHFHALATSCQTESGGKTTRITSGWILVGTDASSSMPGVEVEGSTSGTEELSFKVFRHATSKR